MDQIAKRNIVAAAVANVTRQIHPHIVRNAVSGLSPEDIGYAFQSFKELGQASWLALSVCVGVSYEQDGGFKGEGSIQKTCEKLGISRQSGYRLLAIYEGIVKPRLEAEGAQATFPLEEQAYYVVACEAAKKYKRDPLELLHHAEERKAAFASYTSLKFKEDLNFGESGWERDGVAYKIMLPELRRLLRRVRAIAPDSVRDCRQRDVDSLRELIRTTKNSLERLERGLEDWLCEIDLDAPLE